MRFHVVIPAFAILTAIGCGASADHDHAADDLGAASADHTHSAPTADEIGAATDDHSHTASEVGAAEDDHVHDLPTPDDISAAWDDHTHIASEVGAAADDHVHAAADVGAAEAVHAHDEITASSLGAATEDHDHTTPPPGAVACPVDLIAGMDLDTEFGPGTAALTRCLQHQTGVKVVMQINQYCKDGSAPADCNPATPGKAPFALGNIRNLIADWVTTHGMEAGTDFEVAVVVHSQGGLLMRASDPWASQVSDLIDDGVDFYFCQNTVRKFMSNGTLTAGAATSEIIDGVQYTTAGVSALADFQASGYRYIQP